MPTNPPLKLHVSPNPVRLDSVIDSEGQLELYYRDTPLSACNDALVIYYPAQDALSVTVEIHDSVDASEQRWTITANHGVAWARGNDHCSHAWKETSAEVRVDVTATANGVAKPKPLFIEVLPEGDRPW
jgi:hypothetical protein